MSRAAKGTVAGQDGVPMPIDYEPDLIFSECTLLVPVRLGPKLYDGTIAPYTHREHSELRLTDRGRFLEVANIATGKLRWVPWVQVSSVEPRVGQ